MCFPCSAPSFPSSSLEDFYLQQFCVKIETTIVSFIHALYHPPLSSIDSMCSISHNFLCSKSFCRIFIVPYTRTQRCVSEWEGFYTLLAASFFMLYLSVYLVPFNFSSPFPLITPEIIVAISLNFRENIIRCECTNTHTHTSIHTYKTVMRLTCGFSFIPVELTFLSIAHSTSTDIEYESEMLSVVGFSQHQNEQKWCGLYVCTSVQQRAASNDAASTYTYVCIISATDTNKFLVFHYRLINLCVLSMAFLLFFCESLCLALFSYVSPSHFSHPFSIAQTHTIPVDVFFVCLFLILRLLSCPLIYVIC